MFSNSVPYTAGANNNFGLVMKDEPVFARDSVECVGQVGQAGDAQDN